MDLVRWLTDEHGMAILVQAISREACFRSAQAVGPDAAPCTKAGGAGAA